MSLSFTKMHGLGNDMCLIESSHELSPHTIKKMSHRHSGIGFDQCLHITAIDGSDVYLKIYNADGSQVYQCGNGLRCVMRYIHDQHNLTNARILVGSYCYEGSFHNNQPMINMGLPSFEQTAIPTTLDIQSLVTIHQPEAYTMGLVHLGNPHAICLWPQDHVNRSDLAQRIQHCGFFPEGINVSFIKQTDQHLTCETHERGVGLTEACGSAACAAVIIAHRFLNAPERSDVYFTSGKIHVQITAQGILQSGPACTVYKGTYL